MTLPGRQTRSLLRSFWLVWCGLFGLAAALLLWRRGPAAGLAGLLLGAAVALPGWWWPRLAATPYAAWSRLSDLVARGTRLWITAVCFGILAIVGRAGARFAWAPPAAGTSGWRPRPPERPGVGAGGVGPPAKGWVRELVGWGWESRQAWVWALVPFLLLLSAVQGGPKGSLGGDVYTLY